MSKIAVCFMIPLCILFAGLSPIHTWAIPLAIGGAIIISVLIASEYEGL